MGVHIPNENQGQDGFAESHGAFVETNESNAKALLNHAEGKQKNAPRPAYNPDHPDNRWPLMVHHAAKGELTVGRSLVGVINPNERKRITFENEAALKAELQNGYRMEPYVKPQVAVLDPASEKAALLKRNQELEGQINILADKFAQFEAEQAAKK